MKITDKLLAGLATLLGMGLATLVANTMTVR